MVKTVAAMTVWLGTMAFACMWHPWGFVVWAVAWIWWGWAAERRWEREMARLPTTTLAEDLLDDPNW